MLGEQEYRDMLARGWAGGKAEGTPCGSGSTLQHTEKVRERLPGLAADYGIESVCDAGAGDLHWISKVDWKVKYRAFDLIPRHPGVEAFDIRSAPLPACDLILCRLVLGHMNPEWVQQTLAQFRLAGKYLLATSHDGANALDRVQSFNQWNLSAEPFNLGDPLESIEDAKGYRLNLWRLQ